MKVIFLDDVPRVAKAGEVKEVADGYGRNFLIPRKLALLATPKAIEAAEAQVKKIALTQTQTEAEMVELAGQLDGREIFLEARTGGKDRLYGSITTEDIAAGLESSLGLVVDKRKIDLGEPIRRVGSYEINIKLSKDIVPKIKVTVGEKSA